MSLFIVYSFRSVETEVTGAQACMAEAAFSPTQPPRSHP